MTSGSSKAVPSFKERTAFIETIKKRWRQQKGYCSIFDRVRAEKIQRQKQELKALMKMHKK